MTSGMTNGKQKSLGLMEDLAEMLRAEVLPTHLPLVQLIYKICYDPTLNKVDLYSKYTRLAAVVGGDWITVKEELLNATRFGAPAFYCSISAMLAVFTCRRSSSHEELVSSLTDLYNHISAGNEALNKQVEYAIKTMGRQMDHANVAETSIANLKERVDIAFITIDRQMEHVSTAEARIATIVERADNIITIMEKQEELVKKAELSITNVIERADNATITMEKQMEQVNKAKASITNVIERGDNVITKMEKQEELVKRAEVSIMNVIEQGDKNFKTTMEKQEKIVKKAEARIRNVIEQGDNVITKMEKQEELVKRAEASIAKDIERGDNNFKTTMAKYELVKGSEASIANVLMGVDNTTTTMEKQVEKANITKANIDNITERADNAINKKIKQINLAETKNPLISSSSKTLESRQQNKEVVAIRTATFRCKYGTLTINDQSHCTFNGSCLEAKSLASWFTLPISHTDLKILMNLNHEELIEMIRLNPLLLNEFNNKLNPVDRRGFLDYFFAVIKRKTGQWY